MFPSLFAASQTVLVSAGVSPNMATRNTTWCSLHNRRYCRAQRVVLLLVSNVRYPVNRCPVRSLQLYYVAVESLRNLSAGAAMISQIVQSILVAMLAHRNGASWVV